MSSKKRVVIDVDSVMPLYGRGWVSGIGRTTKELVCAMSEMENLPFEVMLYSQNTRHIGADRIGTTFRTRHIFLPHKPRVNKILGLTHIREIATKYDLLHIPHNFEWVRCPDRTVVTIHDALFFACPDEVYDYEYAQRIYPTLARKCRGIITCSESSKRDIMRYMDIPEDKISVCMWGYDKNVFYRQESRKAGTPYFLCVSCSMGRKNTMAVLKAYEKFIKNDPIHELVLVWPNIPLEAKDFCNKDHLRNHIYVVDDVDDNRLRTLYNEATATFFPSRYEGFGLPVLESMACGTPVVTCRNSSLEEVGGDVALYVEPDDIDGLSEYMDQFENKSYDMDSLSEKCLKRAEQFSWKRCAEETVRVYERYL